MKQATSECGPLCGPFLIWVVILVSLVAPAALAAPVRTSAAITQLGLNNFLVDLYTSHRLFYAIVVTAGTAMLGIILSLVMGWLLRVLRIDRLR